MTARDLHRHTAAHLEATVECAIQFKLANGEPVSYGEAYLAIPEIGYVRHRDRMQGRGRWDARNRIFRCIVRCPECTSDACNRRMWYMLDYHDSHLCEDCKDTRRDRERQGRRPYRPEGQPLEPSFPRARESSPAIPLGDREDRPLPLLDNPPGDLREIGDLEGDADGTLYYTPT